MQVDYFDETQSISKEQEEILYSVLDIAAQELELEDNVEISLVIVSDEKIHEINREYRNKDMITDVISFALEDDESDLDLFNIEELNSEIPRLLGDIYISAPQTARQAVEYEQTFEKELASLAVHGLLHLNGFDHQTDEEAEEMFGLQEKIIGEFHFE